MNPWYETGIDNFFCLAFRQFLSLQHGDRCGENSIFELFLCQFSKYYIPYNLIILVLFFPLIIAN